MTDIFVGRQPILDRDLNLFAYELLFRDGRGNVYTEGTDPDDATFEVISVAFTDIGLDKLVGKHLAFVNTTYKFITNPELLPIEPNQVVLEILEGTTIDSQFQEGIEKLHSRGFSIALDDFLYDPKYEPVFPYVSIVKLDITLIDRDLWHQEIFRLKSRKLKVLAEKVETQEEYDLLSSLGVDYFQGYFFAKPKVVSGKRVSSNKLVLLQLLTKINDPNTEIEELQDIISKDVGFSVKALTYVNSPASGLNRKVESIREAIVFLGRNKIKQWVTLFAISSAEDKPDELMITGLIRAKLCELLAKEGGLNDIDSFFTVGLFSILDAVLDVELEDVLRDMPIPEDMKEALINHKGKKGSALRCVTDLEFGMHDGDLFGIEESTINDLYLQAMNWADNAVVEMGLQSQEET